MKKILVFTAVLSSLIAGQNTLADDGAEVKLKKKCTKEYPLVQGETDQTLLGIYAKVCDTKKDDDKSVLLIQAAQRYQQIGQNLKALQLTNELKSQNIVSTSLTDVQFLAGASIANVAISQMRTNEMRYLSADETYPVAKQLIDSINSVKPATVLVEKVKSSDADNESKPTVRNSSKPKSKQLKNKRQNVNPKPPNNTAKPPKPVTAVPPKKEYPFGGFGGVTK